jgi:hypothetical protein
MAIESYLPLEASSGAPPQYYDCEYWLPHQKFWPRMLIPYDPNPVGFTAYCVFVEGVCMTVLVLASSPQYAVKPTGLGS